MTPTTNHIQGILISCTDVNTIEQHIAEIRDWANKHHAANAQEEIKLTKAFCRKIINLLDDCFVDGVWAVEKTKRRLKTHMESVNDTLVGVVQYDAASVLAEIQSMLPNAVSFANLPSCRPLLALTKELAISGLKKLSDNKIFHTIVDAVEISADTVESVRLGKLLKYYNHYVEELESAMEEKQGALTAPEQWLLAKSRAERAYSYQLMLKYGITVSKDIAEIMKAVNIDDDVRHYEALPDKINENPNNITLAK